VYAFEILLRYVCPQQQALVGGYGHDEFPGTDVFSFRHRQFVYITTYRRPDNESPVPIRQGNIIIIEAVDEPGRLAFHKFFFRYGRLGQQPLFPFKVGTAFVKAGFRLGIMKGDILMRQSLALNGHQLFPLPYIISCHQVFPAEADHACRAGMHMMLFPGNGQDLPSGLNDA